MNQNMNVKEFNMGDIINLLTGMIPELEDKYNNVENNNDKNIPSINIDNELVLKMRKLKREGKLRLSFLTKEVLQEVLQKNLIKEVALIFNMQIDDIKYLCELNGIEERPIEVLKLENDEFVIFFREYYKKLSFIKDSELKKRLEDFLYTELYKYMVKKNLYNSDYKKVIPNEDFTLLNCY